MDTSDQDGPTPDEQLSSVGFRFETGWLAGVLLGSIVIVSATWRRARRLRRARSFVTGTGGQSLSDRQSLSVLPAKEPPRHGVPQVGARP